MLTWEQMIAFREEMICHPECGTLTLKVWGGGVRFSTSVGVLSVLRVLSRVRCGLSART